MKYNETFDSAILTSRLKNVNCEFNLPPQTAISEFSETENENLKYVKENLDILEQQLFPGFIQKTKKIDQHLNVLDSKQRDETNVCI